MKSCAYACLAAAWISSSVAPLRPTRNVKADALVEQNRLLGDNGNVVPQVPGADGTDIGAANPHRADLRIVEAQQQIGEGGFAGAGAADQGHQLAGLDRQVDVVEDGLFTVGEADIVETNGGAVGMEGLGVGRFGQGGLLGEYVIDRVHCQPRQTQLMVQPAQVLDWGVEVEHADEEEQEFAASSRRITAVERKPGKDQGDADAANELDQGTGQFTRPHRPHEETDHSFGGLAELLHDVSLEVIALHHANAGEGFMHHFRQVGEHRRDARVRLAGLARDNVPGE